MIHRVHSTTANHTTYKRKIFCDECGKLVTHEGVIDLFGVKWIAQYYCDQQHCPKHLGCKYITARHDTKPPIIDKYEFKAKVKGQDILEGFIIDG